VLRWLLERGSSANAVPGEFDWAPVHFACMPLREVDHFDPLCNGGSNEKENLWFQPIHAMWNGKDFGFKTKDRLEAFVCVEMKAGRMDPKVAYDKMTTDWVQFYLDNEANLPKNGGGVQ
jgi:hypothetical protein